MATHNQRTRRTRKRKEAENKRRLKIQAAVSDFKAKLLTLKIVESAGGGLPRDREQIPAIERLIIKYEAILTEDRR